jgi:hypothetical protein
MVALRSERQRYGPQHAGEVQPCVEVREQQAPARGLPAQGGAETFWIDRNEKKVRGIDEMLSGGVTYGGSGREMKEAVALICLGALIDASGPRLSPGFAI